MTNSEILCWTNDNRDKCADIMPYVQAGVAEETIVKILDVSELAVKQAVAVYRASKGESAEELQLDSDQLSQLRQSHMIERCKQLWLRTQDSELSETQTQFLVSLSQASVTGTKPQPEHFAKGAMTEFVNFAKRLSSIIALEQEHLFLQIEANNIPHDPLLIESERQKTQTATGKITTNVNKMSESQTRKPEGLLIDCEPTFSDLTFVHAKIFLERYLEERQSSPTVEIQRMQSVTYIFAQMEGKQTRILLCALCELSACRLSLLTKKLKLADRVQLFLDGIYDLESPLIVSIVGRSLQVNNELAWIMSYAETDQDLAEIRDKGMVGAVDVRQREPTDQQMERYQHIQARQKILGELIVLLLKSKLWFLEEELILLLQLATERTLLDRSNSSRHKDLGPSFPPLLPPSLVFDCVANFSKTNEINHCVLAVLDQYCQCLKAGPHYQGGPPSAEGKKVIEKIDKTMSESKR
jgi:hypothetical protein